jgi:ubiquinone/menaquinone biosynthesis C-methylase UbiE
MISEERKFRLAEQSIVVDDFPAEGLILDIGGGGEGVIGQLKGAQVVAIDAMPRELSEAPAGPLKIVMDARELKFLDNTFSTVTAFFSFMFMPPHDHARVFQEIFRVLTPKGRFMLWDIEIQKRPEPQRDLLVFPLQVTLPATLIHTGYGTPYTERSITMEDYIALAKESGFQALDRRQSGQNFFCLFQKP